jgi:hypothetical protein
MTAAHALRSFVGPRVPADAWARRRRRYLLPTVLLIIAAGMLVVSMMLPYWHMTLHAPQYPKGLHVTAYLNHLEGDVQEIDGLNHYIGMRPLHEAAQFERETAIMMVSVLSLLVVAAVFVHTRWAALLATPALLFPVGFLADLWFWLNRFGQNLDPRAPLSGAIKPFTPPVLGSGFVGQFETVATPEAGLILAACASVVIAAALWLHRAAYKPLVDATDSNDAKERA